MADNENNDLITLTADIVSAHVANNAVHTVDIAKLGREPIKGIPRNRLC
jgi:predicted transcriptional regulator